MFSGHCELWIELERGERVYGAGDPVRGAVVVEVSKDCRCDGLHVELGWYTHGKGNSVEQTCAQTRVFSGEWRADEQARFPFEFRLPNGPFTYHGHLLNLDWYVWASADIPWAIDPKIEEDILVASRALDQPLDYPVTDKSLTITSAGTLSPGRTALLIVSAVLLSATALLVVRAALFGDPLLAVTAVVTGLLGALLGASPMRKMLAEQKLGPVQVEIVPQHVVPGDEMVCGVSFRPPGAVTLKRASVHLVGVERVVYNAGTERMTYTHTFFSWQELLAEGPVELPAGRYTQLQGGVRLPPDAPLSLDVGDTEVAYTVEFHLDIDGWPDWVRKYHFVVIPPRRALPSAASWPKLETGGGGAAPGEGLW